MANDLIISFIASLIITFSLWFIGGLLLLIHQAWEKQFKK